MVKVWEREKDEKRQQVVRSHPNPALLQRKTEEESSGMGPKLGKDIFIFDTTAIPGETAKKGKGVGTLRKPDWKLILGKEGGSEDARLKKKI